MSAILSLITINTSWHSKWGTREKLGWNWAVCQDRNRQKDYLSSTQTPVMTNCELSEIGFETILRSLSVPKLLKPCSAWVTPIEYSRCIKCNTGQRAPLWLQNVVYTGNKLRWLVINWGGWICVTWEKEYEDVVSQRNDITSAIVIMYWKKLMLRAVKTRLLTISLFLSSLSASVNVFHWIPSDYVCIEF